MAHVELSLSEPFALGLRSGMPAVASSERFASLDRWVAAVRAAVEPCLVIDDSAEVVAVSPSACSLLGFAAPDIVVGRVLYASDLLTLVDFSPVPATLPDAEVEKIPPLLALASGRLARGLMRVRSGTRVVTIDAVATPLSGRNGVSGSLTFFCVV